jgi:hypothetical protein
MVLHFPRVLVLQLLFPSRFLNSGMDVLAVREAVKFAVVRARAGVSTQKAGSLEKELRAKLQQEAESKKEIERERGSQPAKPAASSGPADDTSVHGPFILELVTYRYAGHSLRCEAIAKQMEEKKNGNLKRGLRYVALAVLALCLKFSSFFFSFLAVSRLCVACPCLLCAVILARRIERGTKFPKCERIVTHSTNRRRELLMQVLLRTKK